MNKLLTFTGGKPNFNIDDVMWNDDALRLALTALLRGYNGDNWIVQGCELTVPYDATIQPGYIMLDGELLKVDAQKGTGKYFNKVITYNAGGDVTFVDGTARQTWQQNRAVLNATVSNLDYKLTSNEHVIFKVIPIGGWDMDTDLLKTIAHGLSEAIETVRTVHCTILNDGKTLTYDLQVDGGITVDSTNINISRTDGGFFDSTSFNDGAINRGYITIGYQLYRSLP